MSQGPEQIPARIGPILQFRGYEAGRMSLGVVLTRPVGEVPGPVVTAAGESVATLLSEAAGRGIWRYDIRLDATAPWYRLEGDTYEVACDLEGDLRIGFVACNGQEHGDLTRSETTRNAMWARLCEDHRARPLGLLLHGGDQIYADEVTDGHPLTAEWPATVHAARGELLADLHRYLRDRFAERYLAALGGAAPGWLMARVPSLAMWDDHDICDGWGSLPLDRLQSPVGQILFQAAREACLLFQHGLSEAERPEGAFGFVTRLPGLALVVPDLRSERRPDRVMGPEGWDMIEGFDPQPEEHVMLVSTVPLLGPRLSLIEGIMVRLPGMQKYEDDLRDQWQSRWHRDAWRRMLEAVLEWRARGPVTVLSGEIHLATRGEMAGPEGKVHQLVASGISHPAPPQAFARGLGWLAGLGCTPVPDAPISLHPLPAQTATYTAERNYLVLERSAGRWSARWHLEQSGVTEPLDLG